MKKRFLSAIAGGIAIAAALTVVPSVAANAASETVGASVANNYTLYQASTYRYHATNGGMKYNLKSINSFCGGSLNMGLRNRSNQQWTNTNAFYSKTTSSFTGNNLNTQPHILDIDKGYYAFNIRMNYGSLSGCPNPITFSGTFTY